MKTYLKHRLALFNQPAFGLFFLSAVIATLANGFVYISNVWLVTARDHSLSAVVVSFMAFWVPQVIFSPFAGAIIDRVDRKVVVASCIFFSGLCFAVFGLVLHFHPHLNLWWIYLVYALLGFSMVFFMPSITAFMREIIVNKDLLYANANLDFGYEVSNICGIGVAGYLIHFLGFTFSYLLVSLLFFISGLCVLLIRNQYRNRISVPEREFHPIVQWLSDIKKSGDYLRANSRLVFLYTTQLFLLLTLMVAPAMLGPFARKILHLEAIGFAQLEIMLAIGVIFGGIILVYLAEKITFNAILIFSSALLGVSLLYFSTVNTLHMGMLAYFFVGFSLGSWSLLIARAQECTDPAFQGRLQSLFGSITAFGITMLYLMITVFSHVITIRHIYWIVALFAVPPIILIVLRPAYFRKPADDLNVDAPE